MYRLIGMRLGVKLWRRSSFPCSHSEQEGALSERKAWLSTIGSGIFHDHHNTMRCSSL